ncbi:hypothetical protein LWC33_26655 [Pseudonocardia sp. RS11V-5]|uniref:hypothetical protein n=1 Tax=Pseudonocardia terrae TaxID=2905831 RepID=UPI001E651556|nr:hypothetical protein [Pseudonocardia terrae]MCE3555022.1 hypothetical protein [Pseudonocardia terrae]
MGYRESLGFEIVAQDDGRRAHPAGPQPGGPEQLRPVLVLPDRGAGKPALQRGRHERRRRAAGRTAEAGAWAARAGCGLRGGGLRGGGLRDNGV